VLAAFRSIFYIIFYIQLHIELLDTNTIFRILGKGVEH